MAPTGRAARRRLTIATYCIPASFGVAALLGTGFVSWRRLLWFGALTAVGAFGGPVGSES